MIDSTRVLGSAILFNAIAIRHGVRYSPFSMDTDILS